MGIGSTPTISLGAIDHLQHQEVTHGKLQVYSSGILNDILNRDAGQDWRNWMNILRCKYYNQRSKQNTSTKE